jgi:hypothetical protein
MFLFVTGEGPQRSLHTNVVVKNKTQKLGFWSFGFMKWSVFPCSTHHKKMIGTPNKPIIEKKIPKKCILSTSKVKRNQNFVWSLPNGIFMCNPIS